MLCDEAAISKQSHSGTLYGTRASPIGSSAQPHSSVAHTAANTSLCQNSDFFSGLCFLTIDILRMSIVKYNPMIFTALTAVSFIYFCYQLNSSSPESLDNEETEPSSCLRSRFDSYSCPCQSLSYLFFYIPEAFNILCAILFVSLQKSDDYEESLSHLQRITLIATTIEVLPEILFLMLTIYQYRLAQREAKQQDQDRSTDQSLMHERYERGL